MATRTTLADTGSVEQPIRSNRLMWFVIAAAVVVVAVITTWLAIDDSSTPTLTFDGESITYDGPTTFDAGEVTFVMDASDYGPGVALLISELNDDSITVDDAKAYAADHSATRVPSWVEDFEAFFATAEDPEDRVIEKTVTLNADTRYLLSANTAPSDTDYIHVAAIIDAK